MSGVKTVLGRGVSRGSVRVTGPLRHRQGYAPRRASALAGFAAGCAATAALLLPTINRATAADLSVREISRLIHTARNGAGIDLTRRNLSELDLAGLNLMSARLTEADLSGADLSGANLERAELSGAKLNRATLLRSNFNGAVLRDASITLPAVSSTFDISAPDAPSFRSADLSRVRLVARMSAVDFEGASFVQANLSPHESAPTNFMMLRTTLASCKLAFAQFQDADLTGVLFEFSTLNGANFRGANLAGADLTGTDLRFADFTGANLQGADFRGAAIENTLGLDASQHRGTANNLRMK